MQITDEFIETLVDTLAQYEEGVSSYYLAEQITHERASSDDQRLMRVRTVVALHDLESDGLVFKEGLGLDTRWYLG